MIDYDQGYLTAALETVRRDARAVCANCTATDHGDKDTLLPRMQRVFRGF